MAQIGLKNLFYAPITEDANGNETYGAPVRLAKAISADLSVESDNAVLYADDGADVTIREFQSGTITLGINDLGNSVAAALLGARIDENGVLVSAGEDSPAPVAIGFQSRSAKGGDRYIWLYRVTFGIPGQTMNTKGESIEFATPSIEGTISRRNRLDSGNKHPWKSEVKAGEPGVGAGVVSSWFNTVYESVNTISTDLSDLAITDGDSTTIAISPTFDAAVTEYTASTDSPMIAFETADVDAGASLAIYDANGNTYGVGGETDISVAEYSTFYFDVSNGYTTKRYTLTVHYTGF